MRSLCSPVYGIVLMLGGLTALPSSASAEPVRVSINFTVVGSPADPDFGSSTATGSFTFVTAQEAGTDVMRPEGFGLETMAFSWAGVEWDATNADIYRIGREQPDGRIFAFSVGGKPSGLDLSFASPDFRLLFCVANVQGPDTNCSSTVFEYSTARSSTLGIFTGFIPNLSISREPIEAPVPEPMTLLLVGSGLGAIAARRRFRVADDTARRVHSGH
jgi:hypothetical protein